MAHVTQWKSSVLKNTKKCTRTPRTVEKPFESRQDTGLRSPSGTHGGAAQGPSASLDDCLLSSENSPSTSVITRIPPQPCACVTDRKKPVKQRAGEDRTANPTRPDDVHISVDMSPKASSQGRPSRVKTPERYATMRRSARETCEHQGKYGEHGADRAAHLNEPTRVLQKNTSEGFDCGGGHKDVVARHTVHTGHRR